VSGTSPPDPPLLEEQRKEESLATRYGLLQRAGGILAPILTVLLALVAGGVVVLITTGSLVKPFQTFEAVFRGAGLNWFFPWEMCRDCPAALNLQQTLLLWTTLTLTGLAVAFAFRCGLFNIGGNGQYLAGSIAAVLVAGELPKVVDLPSVLLILLTVVVAMLAGAALAGIAGILKATVGAHEVITTIMLNWIVLWTGSYLFGVGGPFQSDVQESLPVSNDIAEKSHLSVWWGDPILQGLHIGFFVALGALFVYWAILNRTTLGYEVRAVGHNPEAARYGGISVARNYFLAMAISGMFAGLAGALDVLGWKFRLDLTDIQASTVGFVGIAVALLGRNTAVGVGLAALLFAALQTGTSTRNLDPSIFPPELASNLTLIIQGLIILFVGADLIVLLALRRFRRRSAAPARVAEEAAG
jgi:simple sugar transport system permease protein